MGTHRTIGRGVSVGFTVLSIAAACAGPEGSTGARSLPPSLPTARSDVDDPNSAAGDDKRIIHGWLNGETVPLR